MSNHLDRVSAVLEQLVPATQPCTSSPLTLLIPDYKLDTACAFRNMLESGGVSRLLPHMWEAEGVARRGWSRWSRRCCWSPSSSPAGQW